VVKINAALYIDHLAKNEMQAIPLSQSEISQTGLKMRVVVNRLLSL